MCLVYRPTSYDTTNLEVLIVSSTIALSYSGWYNTYMILLTIIYESEL